MGIYETNPNHEPSVFDLLDDPITQLLMQRDGVERDSLAPLLDEVANRVSEAA